MQPLWIELWVTIEVPRENNCVERVMLQKDMRLMTLPTLGSYVILDKDNFNYMAKVVKIVMVEYDETNLHHTAAWVYTELEKDELLGDDPEVVVTKLENEHGWQPN